MNSYVITWFWTEEFEILGTDTKNYNNRDHLRSFLVGEARRFFDNNPRIETLKASVVDFDHNISYVIEFEKKPVGQYEILTTEY